MTGDCPHVVRQYDERGYPVCGQCGASLVEYDPLPDLPGGRDG
jgi:hypothetical protein